MYYMLEWHKFTWEEYLRTQRHVEKEKKRLTSTQISHYPSKFLLLPLELLRQARPVAEAVEAVT